MVAARRPDLQARGETRAIYASYSRSYLPRGGDQLTSLNLTNQSLDPEALTNYEIGAKWDINPELQLVNAALYQLERDNVIVLIDPNDPVAGTGSAAASAPRGLELAVAGNLTPMRCVGA